MNENRHMEVQNKPEACVMNGNLLNKSVPFVTVRGGNGALIDLPAVRSVRLAERCTAFPKSPCIIVVMLRLRGVPLAIAGAIYPLPHPRL